jgi:hypothetical protein
MDREGFSYPSQETIAKGARASVRTVQRHIAAAELAGWIGIQLAGRGGKGWRHYVYRAAVPDDLPIDEIDEKLSDVILAKEGDIERGDTAMSPPTKVVTETFQGRGDNGGPKVATNDHDGGDTGDANVATQLCRTNSRSETPALRTHTKREAHADACAASSSLAERNEAKKQTPTSASGETLQQRVLQGGIALSGNILPKPLRQISDEQLSKQLDRLASAGMTSVVEASRVLSGNYADVGVDRLWRVIETQRQQQREVSP